MSPKGLKILYVITSLRFGGAEKLVVELSLRLKRDGHEVEVFLLDSTDTPLVKLLEDEGVLIYKASKGYFQMWNLFQFSKLKKLLRKNKYNIVHTHNTPAQILAYLAESREKTATTFITTEHNTYNRRRVLPLVSLFDRKMYGFYDKVICVSDGTRINLLRYLSSPIIDNKYVTIFNGVDFSKYRVGKIEKPDEYKEKVVILMVAAFRKQKDQPTLIRALKHLPDNYVVWLAGDGIRRIKCERLVKQLNIENRVIFLGNRTDIPALYGMADIIAISSHYEGMSLSSIEALASGKPMIASDVEGLREIVGKVGILFREGDEKDLSEKILSLKDHEEVAEKNIISGSSCIEEFDIYKTYTEYKKIYSRL